VTIQNAAKMLQTKAFFKDLEGKVLFKCGNFFLFSFQKPKTKVVQQQRFLHL
jgi:hypothetical protein